MDKKVSRRDFFKRLGIGTIGLGFGISLFDGIYQYGEAITDKEKHALVTRGSINFKGFLTKEITPNDEFFVTSYSTKVPQIDPAGYNLRIEGLVEEPYTLSFEELKKIRDKGEFVTLECIGNPLGGDSIGNALWEGVTLRKIIERARPRRGIVKTVFYGEDGYIDSIPYTLSLSDDVFLAFLMNSKPLPAIHGYPLRVIVPGIYGMKNVKWLSKIEFVDYDFKGYWEKKGWSDEAIIPIKSQILKPKYGDMVPLGHYVIGGIAFAGRFGIGRVQVSIDGGRSWHNAELKKPLSRWAWVLWRYDWLPSKEGEYIINVRGIDSSGKIQESPSLIGRIFQSTYPDGARGYHNVKVRVIR